MNTGRGPGTLTPKVDKATMRHIVKSLFLAHGELTTTRSRENTEGLEIFTPKLISGRMKSGIKYFLVKRNNSVFIAKDRPA